MKSFEDIIKDRLEDYESRLPDCDVTEFEALLNGSKAPAKKSALPIWLASAAVAAGLALFFIPKRYREPKQEPVQNQAPVSLMAEAETEASKPDSENKAIVAMAHIPSSTMATTGTNTESPAESTAESPAAVKSSAETEDASTETAMPASHKRDAANDSQQAYSYPRPEKPGQQTFSTGKTAAGVLGSAGAIALANCITFLKGADTDVTPAPFNPNWISGLPSLEKYYAGTKEMINYFGLIPLLPERTGNDKHHIPLRNGLSLRIPINDRWSLTTGLDYIWAFSEIEYEYAGGIKQNAHYLGIPLRLDLTLAQNRWLNLYVGAGASADWGIAATLLDTEVDPDGIAFSLTGTTGVQFNITDHLGLYLEPGFSWNIPSENRILDSYISEHPFMFSASSGIRFTLK